MAKQKFNEEDRTFETRVKFIHDIFSNKYSDTQIMSSCIKYKLDKSYAKYVKKLYKNAWKLEEEKDIIKVLRKVEYKEGFNTHDEHEFD